MSREQCSAKLSGVTVSYPDGGADHISWTELLGQPPLLRVPPEWRDRCRRLPEILHVSMSTRLWRILRERQRERRFTDGTLDIRVEIESQAPSVVIAAMGIAMLMSIWLPWVRHAGCADADLIEYLPPIYLYLKVAVIWSWPLLSLVLFAGVHGPTLLDMLRRKPDRATALRFTHRALHVECASGVERVFPWADLCDIDRRRRLWFEGAKRESVQLPQYQYREWIEPVRWIARNRLGREPFIQNQRRSYIRAAVLAFVCALAGEVLLACALPRLTDTSPPFGCVLGFVTALAALCVLGGLSEKWAAGDLPVRRRLRRRRKRKPSA